MEAVIRDVRDEALLFSHRVAVLQLRLKAEPVLLAARGRAIVIAPALEHRVLQEPVRPVQAEIRGEETELPGPLVQASEQSIPVVQHVAQKHDAAGLVDPLASQLLRPADLRDPIHLADGLAVALVAVFVLKRVVVRVRRAKKRHLGRPRRRRGGNRRQTECREDEADPCDPTEPTHRGVYPFSFGCRRSLSLPTNQNPEQHCVPRLGRPQESATTSTWLRLKRASSTRCSMRWATGSSIQSAPHWEQTEAGTLRITTTPKPRSAVNVVVPGRFVPLQIGQMPASFILHPSSLILHPHPTSPRCAQTFSNALAYWSTSSGTALVKGGMAIAVRLANSEPGSDSGISGLWCHHSSS